MNLLEHVSTPIIESYIICEYLEDAYPEVSFRPNDPILKSQMRFWMKHVDVKLHPSCGAIQWPMIMRDSMLKRSEDERNVLLSKIPEKPRRERQKRLIQYGLDAPDVSDAVKTYYKTIVDMEKALSQHKWLVGNEFSLADICVSPYFQTLHQFEWTGIYEEKFPKVTQWYANCRARQSYKEAVIAEVPQSTFEALGRKGRESWPKIKLHLPS